MKKKKKDGGLLFFIFIIVLVLIGLLVYLLKDEDKDKKPVNQSVSEKINTIDDLEEFFKKSDSRLISGDSAYELLKREKTDDDGKTCGFNLYAYKYSDYIIEINEVGCNKKLSINIYSTSNQILKTIVGVYSFVYEAKGTGFHTVQCFPVIVGDKLYFVEAASSEVDHPVILRYVDLKSDMEIMPVKEFDYYYPKNVK